MSRQPTTAAVALAAAVTMVLATLTTVAVAGGEDLPPPDQQPALRRLQALRLGVAADERQARWAAARHAEEAAAAQRAAEVAARAAEEARRAAARRTAPPAAAEPVVSTTIAAPAGDGSYLGEFTVTCYSLRGTTASGRPVGPEVVAVDPRVIPLGTWIHIEGVGNRQASDTGGDVKGRRLDIWHESRDWCIQFGRRVLSVHRL